MATENIIHLSYVTLEVLEDAYLRNQCYDLLSAIEKKRYNAFEDPQQANQFLLGRVMLRIHLSQHVPSVLPHEWVFFADEHGKPRVGSPESQSHWQFNLSHSENRVVLAISEGLELGVDVEYVARPVFSMAMAKHYFSQSEYRFLNHLDAESRAQHIAQFWALKESYLKACGLGLRIPMSKVIYTFDQSTEMSLTLPCDSSIQGSSQVQWATQLYSLDNDYVVALTCHLNEANSQARQSTRINQWMAQVQQENAGLSLLRTTIEQNMCEIS